MATAGIIISWHCLGMAAISAARFSVQQGRLVMAPMPAYGQHWLQSKLRLKMQARAAAEEIQAAMGRMTVSLAAILIEMHKVQEL